MTDRLVVLVPSYRDRVEPACEDALRALEEEGVEVRVVGGHAAIDRARSLMATEALADGFDALMWIDDDILFRPEDVLRLHGGSEPFVAGLYPKKGKREIAAHVLPGTRTLRFGEGGGPIEVRYVGAGFLYTRREVYEAVRPTLPICDAGFGEPLVPYFMPQIVESDRGHWYLGEDYSFCERARRAGFRVLADTSIRLYHVGRYAYGWEDAGQSRERFASYDYAIVDQPVGLVPA